MVESREARRIGDYTTLFGELFYIYQIKSRYIGGELLHFCYMKRKRGIEVPEAFQEEMTGCTLSATVTAVKEDKVQIVIEEDENRKQEPAVWYPYATVYSTPDGTGWYCMPEPGDRVRLTVPEKWEKEAFVTGSLLVAGASSVSFKQKGTSIELENDISFVGGNLKIQ